MNSVPLVLPFTLPASSSTREGSSDPPSCADVLVDQASTIANVSCLTPYWPRSGSASPYCQHPGNSDALEGVALGCEDGTLYFLRQNRNRASAPINIERPLLSRSPSPTPVHLSNRSRSRPRTPTTSLAPFSLASRARVVSGITDEQAQAPKNYVDFDEEPEKLKEMLKGRRKDSTSKDRRPSLSFDRMAATEKLHVLSKTLPSPSSSVRRGEPKSLLSATHSPALSTSSLPSPTSHSAIQSPFEPLYQLSPELHVFPSCSDTGNAVVGLHALVNGRYLICLRSKGYDNRIYSFFDSSVRWIVIFPCSPSMTDPVYNLCKSLNFRTYPQRVPKG
jgi:hypothetical protein